MRVEQLVVGMMGVCCYIVSCDKSKEAAVIDPGGDEERILKYLRDQGLNTKYIINTHGHLDHVCGNAAVQQGTGAQIVMHEADVAYFSDPAIRRYFSGLGLTESPPVDVAVRDGEMIAIGQEQLQVLHTPGHTRGSVAYVVDGQALCGCSGTYGFSQGFHATADRQHPQQTSGPAGRYPGLAWPRLRWLTIHHRSGSTK